MITPTLHNMIVQDATTVLDALAVIDANAQGIVFVVDKSKKVIGVLADGDVRRGILAGVSVHDLVVNMMNREFICLDINTPPQTILKTLNKKIRHIPLVDQEGKLVDFASFQKLNQIPVMEPWLENNEMAYVVDCMQSKWISSQGAYVDRFEQTFSKLFGGLPALTTSNGTTALHLAMTTLGIGEGDEVIVPNLTFAASINTILHANATPVIVDVCPKSWCIDPVAIEQAITPRTKAIMPVHLYGQPCDMDAIMDIASRHRLFVVEDVAEALGSTYKGRLVGTFGHAACFSFYGNKMITTGEGGMIVFQSADVASKARMLRDHGMRPERRYWHEEVGYNYRMTNLQAAIGLAQLEKFDEICRRKNALNTRYFNALSDCPYITLPPRIESTYSVYWLFTVCINDASDIDRDGLIAKLKKNSIDSRPVFYPLSDMPIYKKYTGNRTLPVSQQISRQGVSLPSSITLSNSQIDYVAVTIRSLFDIRSYITNNAQANSKGLHP